MAFATMTHEQTADALEEVRAALDQGADESLWPPGLTPGQAVARLVERVAILEAALRDARRRIDPSLSPPRFGAMNDLMTKLDTVLKRTA